MFEKDANDSFNCKKVLYKWETDKRSYIDGFKDGAEFGYNKAKEEMQEQIEKMKCCRNCKKLDNRKVECSEGSDLIYFFGKNCDKWEIKEK